MADDPKPENPAADPKSDDPKPPAPTGDPAEPAPKKEEPKKDEPKGEPEVPAEPGEPNALDLLNEVATRVFKGEMVEKMSAEYPDVPESIIKLAESEEQAKQLVVTFRDETKKLEQKQKQEAEKGIAGPQPLPPEELREKIGKLKGSGDLDNFFALQSRQHGVKIG